MGRYIIKRISYILLVFLLLSFLLFMIYHMLPVDKAAEKAREEAALTDKLCDVTLGYLLACEE